MSVLLHTARPAVQHLPPAGAAPLAHEAPWVCRMRLWGRCDSTFRTEGQSSLCGSGAQLLLRARGSELHPWVRKRCLGSKCLQTGSGLQQEHCSSPSEPQATHSTPQNPTTAPGTAARTKDHPTFPLLVSQGPGSEVKASVMLCSEHCPHSLALCCAGVPLVSPTEWHCQCLW